MAGYWNIAVAQLMLHLSALPVVSAPANHTSTTTAQRLTCSSSPFVSIPDRYASTKLVGSR
ncbi:hypothetical protein PMAYCL1PPCAC_10899, partial [Pristionchus mayeri]